MRIPAAAGIGRGAKHILTLVMQGIVEAADHTHGVAKRRMCRHILHAFAVNPDLAAVAKAFEVLG